MISPEALEKARAIALKAAGHVRNNADAEAVENIVTASVATALQAERDAAVPKLPDDLAGLVERLNGVYRVPITDGLGAVGAGEEPDNPNEFVRRFETPPIQKEAAAAIQPLVARIAELEGMIRWAHDTLYEINPSNYDHDEVCRVNNASVEVILGLAPILGETHGKTAEWWAARLLNKDRQP